MKFFTVLAVVLTTAFSAMAQDLEGYYINNSGQRVSGYFKDADFTDASLLQFKEAKVGIYRTFPANDAKEYGVGTTFKFVKHNVKYDTSSSYDDALTTDAEPQWKEDIIFLNVLTEGSLTMYSYYNKGYKFFYSVSGATPQQLIYKKYKAADGQILKNETFKEQLIADAVCEKLKSGDYNDLYYTKLSLVKFAEKYNRCKNDKAANYTNESVKTESSVSIAVYAGLRNSSFKIKNSEPPVGKDTALNWAVGFEAAVKINEEGTWEAFGRAEYEKVDFENSGTVDRTYNSLTTTYTYSSSIFSMGLGPRYNILLNSSRLYIDAMASLAIPSGNIESYSVFTPSSSPSYTTKNVPDKTETTFYVTFGIGYEFGEKVGLELRYYSPKNLLSRSSRSTALSALGLNLRYTIL